MANRYWVGGSGTWDGTSTTNWSATSGGVSGASAPTNADTAIFDANSGTAATVSVAATATCASAIINKADINLSLTGSPTFVGTVTFTAGTISLNIYTLTCNVFSSSNSNARTIAFGTGKIVLTGSGTSWSTTTATNMVVTGTAVVELIYAGSLATGIAPGVPTEANSISFYILAGSYDFSFIAGRACRNLIFNGFTGRLLLGVRTIYGSLSLASGMTVEAGTSITTFAATSGVKNITSNGQTLDFPLVFNGVGGTWSFQDALTMGSTRTLTLTNGTVQLKDGVTSTVGAFATSGTNQKFLESTLAGTQATLSDASGTNSVSYTSIKDINATGGATWNAFVTNGNVDAGNNTGWDFFAQIGRYMYNVRKSKRLLI